jgi:hypothetical protein
VNPGFEQLSLCGSQMLRECGPRDIERFGEFARVVVAGALEVPRFDGEFEPLSLAVGQLFGYNQRRDDWLGGN